MACTISVSLVSERVDGDIGDDWEYTLAAEVFNPASTGSARIDVPKHKLAPGSVQVASDQRAVQIPAGDCGTTARVVLTLTASEVDWVFSDKGEDTATVQIKCPGQDDTPLAIEREVAVHVEEKPRVLGGAANLIVKVRVVASCQ